MENPPIAKKCDEIAGEMAQFTLTRQFRYNLFTDTIKQFICDYTVNLGSHVWGPTHTVSNAYKHYNEHLNNILDEKLHDTLEEYILPKWYEQKEKLY